MTIVQEVNDMFSNKAYVLIRTVPDKTKEAFRSLRECAEVKVVDIITGPYDIIAIIEAPSADEVLDFVMGQVRYIDGITDTVTCFAVRTTDQSPAY